jgi:DNA-binding NarL/FixJ family response regulator
VSPVAESSRGATRVAGVRVVVVDDHPAMRAGVRAVFDGTPDIALVGEAASSRDLPPVLERTWPDVVLLDFHLPDEDGLVLCHRLKRGPFPPKVVVYSAYADESLIAPAILAQADALLAKHAGAPVLTEAVREVASGTSPPPELRPALRERLVELLEPEDVALAGLLLMRLRPAEVARRTGLEPTEFATRVERMLRGVTAARDRLR